MKLIGCRGKKLVSNRKKLSLLYFGQSALLYKDYILGDIIADK